MSKYNSSDCSELWLIHLHKQLDYLPISSRSSVHLNKVPIDAHAHIQQWTDPPLSTPSIYSFNNSICFIRSHNSAGEAFLGATEEERIVELFLIWGPAAASTIPSGFSRVSLAVKVHCSEMQRVTHKGYRLLGLECVCVCVHRRRCVGWRMYPECLSNLTIGGCPVKRPEQSQDKEGTCPPKVHPRVGVEWRESADCSV